MMDCVQKLTRWLVPSTTTVSVEMGDVCHEFCIVLK
jgi:hypothetical protein